MASTTLTSPQNAQIKAARKLQRRRQRAREGRLLVEGVRLVRDAHTSGAPVRQVFYVPEQVAAQPGAPELLVDLRAAVGEHRIDACTPQVFATLVETIHPQGIAAVVDLPELPLPPACDFFLVLDRVRDPGNAGTLVRTAEAAGVGCVLFGPQTVDPFNDKVVRAGMGAHFRLPLRVVEAWAALDELLADVRLYVADAHAGHSYDQVDWREPAALVVGGEAQGASPEAAARATPIAIPMQGGVESLNAAIAGAVVLFEAARARRLSKKFAG